MSAAGEIDFDQLAALARKAQRGDAGAYEAFLEMLYPFVGMIIRSKLGPVVEADDVTQECLLGVHKALASYHPSRPIRPWIQAIIRYKTADYFRALARRGRVVLCEEMDDVTFTPLDPNSLVETAPDGEVDVQGLVRSLPAPLRRAVVLTKLSGMSSAEAARQEGISEAALRKRVSRAYRKLAALAARELDMETHRGEE